MSLRINVDKVEAVLLPDGVWHLCSAKKGVSTFDLDAYEYVEGDRLLFGGGRESAIPATGATWVQGLGGELPTTYYCPLTSIIAVRHY